MTNAKGDLIDACRVGGLPAPVFATSAAGPEHEPTFQCEVSIPGVLTARGAARTKRDAERSAAAAAMKLIGEAPQAAPSAKPPAAVEPSFEEMPDEFDDDTGPWPVFPEILAECLRVANSRVPGQTSAGLHEVRDLALELYKGLLEDLGEYE